MPDGGEIAEADPYDRANVLEGRDGKDAGALITEVPANLRDPQALLTTAAFGLLVGSLDRDDAAMLFTPAWPR